MRSKDLLSRVAIYATFILIIILIISSSNLSGSQQVTNPVSPKKPSSKIAFLLVGSSKKCIEESPPPKPDSKEIWAEFIGIGPARTGSSNLIWSLKLSPHVQVGIPSLHDQDCCPGSELSFFSNDTLFQKGIEYYRGYFAPRKPNTKIAGEKTPGYSDNPLVPYRIRAMLGPKVKLLFTLREPIEALLSLYILRQEAKKGVPIVEYFETMMHDQNVYDSCIQGKMDALLGPTKFINASYYDVLQSVEWNQAMILDETIMKCWEMKTSLKWHNERLQHYLYKENLIRWHKVMPNQVLCIWSDEYRAYGIKALNLILKFLEVDPLPSNIITPSYSQDHELKQEMKRKLGSLYWKMCEFLKERNRGIEEICPRMWPGEWEWCVDKNSSNGTSLQTS